MTSYIPEAYSMTVDPPAALGPGDKTTATVHVKNISKKTLRAVAVNVWSGEIDFGTMPAPIAKLAPAAEVVLHIGGTVKPGAAPDTISLLAVGNAGYGGTTRAKLTIEKNGQVAQVNGPAASQGNMF